MRILVAPDKFKGSLAAREVGENIATGLREVLPDAQIVILPIADGGEGTVEVIAQANNGSWVTCLAHDAIGRPTETRYYRIGTRGPAVIEMSEAAGIWRINLPEFDLTRASTFGVGEMMLHAARTGAEEIVVALGGSATNDGGLGMARALGFEFLDRNGIGLGASVLELLRLERICPPAESNLPPITAAVDVRVPLLGSNGATAMFGPQKGASADQLVQLEAALSRLAKVVKRDLGCDFSAEPGAGAAGGLGFGLLSFCGASVRSGFDLVADMVALRAAVNAADLVITGEGRLDAQTYKGKAPAGISKLAGMAGKRVFAIVGSMSEEVEAAALFNRVIVLARAPITIQESIEHTPELLRLRARELAIYLSAKAE